jgi:hypothetical protein
VSKNPLSNPTCRVAGAAPTGAAVVGEVHGILWEITLSRAQLCELAEDHSHRCGAEAFDGGTEAPSGWRPDSTSAPA